LGKLTQTTQGAKHASLINSPTEKSMAQSKKLCSNATIGQTGYTNSETCHWKAASNYNSFLTKYV
jgi:hypothetical protein